MVKTSQRRPQHLFGYVLVAGIAALILVGTLVKGQHDRANAIAEYRDVSAAETRRVADNVSVTLRQIYQGIRTIAILPGVADIDPHGVNLTEEAGVSIDANYQNLITNAAISEIYIVPKEMQPEQVDQGTQSFWIPARMFDGTSPAGVGSSNPETLVTSVDQAEHQKFVEIYEYRLIRHQMDSLSKLFPKRSNIKDLNFPMAGGGEVLTCDNSVFDQTQADIDRTGVIFSVPYYDRAGDFAGVISAIVRVEVLSGLLPDARYALVSTANQVALTSPDAAADLANNAYLNQAKADPAYLYSGTAAIQTADPDADWTLWAAYPDANFENGVQATNIRMQTVVGSSLALLIALIGTVVWTILRRSMVKARLQNASLAEQSKRIERLMQEQELSALRKEEERRLILDQLADSFEASVLKLVSRFAHTVNDIGASSQQMARSANESRTSVNNVSQAATQASSNVHSAAEATEQIFSSIGVISRQVEDASVIANTAASEATATNQRMAALMISAGEIGDVINLITEIASQTNLLAINASIEAARAGDVGKGFAVVAAEIKNLANQTSKATGDIVRKIGAIQNSTQQAVHAIERITGTIEKINGIQTVIAGSVSEQGTATKEILRNVSDASQGTTDVSASIHAVARTVQTTSNSAGEMAGLTHSLREETERLRSEVVNFLHYIRNGESRAVTGNPKAANQVGLPAAQGKSQSVPTRLSA